MLPALPACASRWPAPADRVVLGSSEDEGGRGERERCRLSPPSTLPGGAEVTRPALAAGEAGLAVAWIAPAEGGRVIRLQALSSTGLEPLGEPLEVAPGEGMPVGPSLALCRSGPLLVWESVGRVGEEVRLAPLEGLPPRSAGPASVLAASGHEPAAACTGPAAAVVYTSREEETTVLRLLWVERGEPRGPAVALGGETEAPDAPALACDRGRCAVAWTDMREGAAEVYALSVEEGSTEPSTPVRLSAPNRGISGAGGSYRPALGALGSAGYLAVWHDNRSRGESEIYGARWSVGPSASPDRRISASPAPSTDPAVAVCGEGVSVAWRDRRDGPPRVYLASLDRDGRRISPAVAVSDAGEEASAPSLACAGPTPVLAWTESAPEGGVLRLAAVSCE